MKKDQKFLSKLEENLSKISKKKRDLILLKYRKIIDEEKESNKKIVDIIKVLGEPEEIAKKEIKELKSQSVFSKSSLINKLNNIFKKKVNITEAVKEQNSVSKKNTLDELVIKIKKLFKRKTVKKRKSKSQKTKYIRRIRWNFKKVVEKFKTLFKKRFRESSKKIKEDYAEIVTEAVEAIPEVKIFETKSKRIKRIILNVLGIILMMILIFIFLWAVVIFIASLFSILDGLKIYGIVLALFGLMLLMLWFVMLLYTSIYKKKLSSKFLIISVISVVLLIGCGIGYTLIQYYDIKTIKDVSEKYTMTSFTEKYNLPNSSKKLYVSFNSIYKTSYVVEYDEKLVDKIKVEVRYYECYYDFYAKKTTNNVYVSLKLDPRDRLSTYIDGLKEGKVYDSDELSRYTVKIIMNEVDKDRVVIY